MGQKLQHRDDSLQYRQGPPNEAMCSNLIYIYMCVSIYLYCISSITQCYTLLLLCQSGCRLGFCHLFLVGCAVNPNWVRSRGGVGLQSLPNWSQKSKYACQDRQARPQICPPKMATTSATPQMAAGKALSVLGHGDTTQRTQVTSHGKPGCELSPRDYESVHATPKIVAMERLRRPETAQLL